MKNILIFISLFICFLSLHCDKNLPLSQSELKKIESKWTKETLPKINVDWAIYDLEFTSAESGWAVGTIGFNRAIPGSGIILKYDGTKWESVQLPQFSLSWSLNSICMVSESEGWAVGGDYQNSTEVRAVILHYENDFWKRVYPDLEGSNFSYTLASVSFGSPDDGWAVGNKDTTINFSEVNTGILLHYKDGIWQEESSPITNHLIKDCGYYDICFYRPDIGWLSGYDDSYEVKSMIYHYDGKRWTNRTDLSVGYFYHINRLVLDKYGYPWGAGQDEMQWGSRVPSGFIIQYSSDGWVALPQIKEQEGLVEFYAVAPLSINDIWVGGSRQSMHLFWFHDNLWHQVNLQEKFGSIRDIVFTSENNGWAAGIDYTNGFDKGRGIIYRYTK